MREFGKVVEKVMRVNPRFFLECLFCQEKFGCKKPEINCCDECRTFLKIIGKNTVEIIIKELVKLYRIKYDIMIEPVKLLDVSLSYADKLFFARRTVRIEQKLYGLEGTYKYRLLFEDVMKQFPEVCEKFGIIIVEKKQQNRLIKPKKNNQ